MLILAIRDKDSGKVLELRPLTAAENDQKATGDLFATKRQQYPPPRYDLMIGAARSVEMFTRLYPKFKQTTGGGGGDGDDSPGARGQAQSAGAGAAVRPPA